MKTKLLKVSKCTLSLVLSLMMLFSSVFVSSGVTTTITTADTPDTTAADTAEDTAHADDTTAPQKSAAPAKVTPQVSGAGNVTFYFVNNIDWTTVYMKQWHNNSYGYNSNYGATMTHVTGMLWSCTINEDVLTSGSMLFDCGTWGGNSQTVNMSTLGTADKYSSGKIYFVPDCSPYIGGTNGSNIEGTWLSETDYNSWVADYCGKWYIVGRYADGNGSVSGTNYCTNLLWTKFTEYSTDLYYYEPNKTLGELTGNLSGQTKGRRFALRKLTTDGWSDYYQSNGDYEINTGYPDEDHKAPISTSQTGNFTFKSGASSTNNIAFWVDATDSSSVKFYYTDGMPTPTSTTYTLYFDALDSGWTPSANVYDTGNGNADVLATTAMTKYSGTSANIYSVTFSTAVDVSGLKVKFSDNGTTPTDGYDVANGKVYRYDGTVVTDSITTYISNNYAENIYFDKPVHVYQQVDQNNSVDWKWYSQANTYAYFFTDSTNDGTNWPGHQMTLDSSGLYSFDTLRTNKSTVIFNPDIDGDSSNSAYRQSPNFTYETGKVYTYGGGVYDYSTYTQETGDWYVLLGADYVQMTPVAGSDGLFSYETGKTPSEVNDIGAVLFRRKYNDEWLGDLVGATAPTGTSKQNRKVSSTDGLTSSHQINLGADGYYLSFSEYTGSSSGNVTLYLDATNPVAPKFYFEEVDLGIADYSDAQSYTVYVDNSASGWDALAAYPYAKPNASGSADISAQKLIADYPGTSMDFDKTTNLWKLTFSLVKPLDSNGDAIENWPKIIFTDKIKKSSTKYVNTHQTAAQALVNNKVYKIAANGSVTTYDYAGYSQLTSVDDKYYISNGTTNNEMTETSTSGVYKYSTGKTIAQLTGDEFYILEKSEKGSIKHRRSSTLALGQFEAKDKIETYERVYGNFKFNDSSVTQGNVDFFYQPSTGLFWYDFASTPTQYTVSASTTDSNLTSSLIGFKSKKYISGSTATITVTNIPDGKAVASVTAGSTVLTANDDDEYTFTVSADTTITVTLRDKYIINVTMASNPSGAGTVKASKTSFTEGDQIKITAITGVSDYYDYTFTGWTASSNGALKFADGYSSTSTSAMVTPKVTTAPASGNVVAITITANYEGTPLSNVTVDGTTYYISYGVTKEDPQNFNKSKNLKKLTVDGETKYFADFVKNDFLNDGSTSSYGSYINFSLSTSSTASSYTSFVGQKKPKNVVSTNTSVVSGSSQERNVNNESDKTYFAQMTSVDWDSLIAVRLYVDGLDGSTEKVSGNSYKFVPTYETVSKAAQVQNVQFYLKNGTVRQNYEKYSQLATSTVTNEGTNGVTVTNSTAYRSTTKIGYGPVGSTVSIQTKISDGNRNKYYVKAFCVNGISYNVIDEPAAGDARRLNSDDTGYDSSTSGIYTFDYTLPANTDSVEITPIFFYFTDDTSDNKITINGKTQTMEFITFYAEDFAGEVKNKWGSTLSVQAWYSGKAADETASASVTNKNCLGGFPGQPMIYADGVSRYYMQIPKYREDGATVQGVTMNNYVWDDVHAQAEWGITMADSDVDNRKAKNCQTYDYDDFAAIANFGAEEIFFTFKYRTNTNNPSENNAVLDSSVYGNGWNALVDHGNRGIDLFGNRIKKTDYVAGTTGENRPTYSDKDTGGNLSSASSYLTEAFIESDYCDNKIYITSDGYVDYENNNSYKYLGKYATRWTVYRRSGTSGNYTFTKLGALPSSAFVPNETDYKENQDGTIDRTDSDNIALFLSYSSTSGIARTTEWPIFCDLYDTCKGYPAVITYEKAIVQSDEPALRNDGRWYYSKESERLADVELYNIVGNIELEYKASGTTGFVPDTMTESNGVYTGTVTHATPGFTDTDKYVMSGSTQIQEITKIIDGTSYNFASEESTEYTSGNTTRRFVFVGWFLKNDNVYTPVNPTDVTKSTGSTPRLSSETFVARYEEVSGRTLIVNHKTGDGTGTGKTWSVVKIYNPDNGTYVYNERSQGALTVNSIYLDDDYTVTISIEAIADTTSRYASTTEALDGGSATTITSSMVGDVGDTSASKVIVASGTKVSDLFTGTTTLKKYDYVSTFSLATFKVVYCFYDRDTTQNAKIDIKKTPTAVTVNVPYSADDTISQIISNGLNETVKDGSGSVSKLGNILDKYYLWTTQTGTTGAENGIAGLDDISAEKVNGSYQKYSTTQAGNLSKHFDSLGKPITSTVESAYVTTDMTADTIAAIQTDNWVNYKVSGNYVTSIDGELAESAYTPANTNATEVVVWAYNTPKTYHVKFIYPVAADNDGNAGTAESNPNNVVNTEHIVKNSGLINNNGENGTAVDIYSYDYTDDELEDGTGSGTINTNNPEGVNVFYGQRFGSLFTESVTVNNEQINITMNSDGKIVYADGDFEGEEITGDTLTSVYAGLDERDKPGTHIANYGVKLGFSNEKIVVVKQFTKDLDDDGTEETLVFDGWYDASTGAKITATYDYGYRVTSNVTLIAGYRVADVTVTETPRATVSADDFDFYFVENATDNTTITERMRFNTQLNVYDSVDSNSSIKQIGAAYIQLRVEGEGTEYTTRSAYELAQDPDFIEALRQEVNYTLTNTAYSSTDDVAVIPNGTTRTKTQWLKYNGKWVAWKMIYTYNTQYGTDQGNSKQVDLNTKNRAIFTMDINADRYDENNNFSAVLVFGAMKVDSTWVVSDNCVQYINYDAPATTSSTNGGSTLTPSGSSYEESVEDTTIPETP